MVAHLALVTVFIGTYTSPGGSLGIYSATLDEATGRLSTPVLAATMPNPSYLAISRDCRRLYAVDESRRGSVHAFSVLPGGKLIALNSQPTLGGAPCYISVEAHGEDLLTASYNGGVIQIFAMKDGIVGPGGTVVVSPGHGPIADRQEGPHMHWISTDPQDRFIYACDLGTDQVRFYRLDRETPGITGPETDGRAPPGSGPRHGVWGSGGRFLYVNGEMGNNVTTFAVDRTTGSLKALQTLSTLPPGAHSIGSAEIAMHPNGKFAYVSNRGHDSIAVFTVGRDGLLKLVQIASAGVKIPRGFGIDPSGRWLIAAGQESDDLRVLPIDPMSGRLGLPGPATHLSHPVCVVFDDVR